KLRIGSKVFFLGRKSGKNLADFYRASDVLVLTSAFEGMPLVAIEAMSCGLPVVSTNVGELQRVIKKSFSGEIVDTFLTIDIAGAIGKVLDNPRIYSAEHCVNSVSEYKPENVLQVLYRKIRDLDKKYKNATLTTKQ
ncbi:MAG: glycosyltransferase family 4 protein, partial [Candidatus Omnitrophica bacterium]|nr:glycosyltransferase family 4 protein [Candidatus Omnitrophota bacterium]